MKLYRILAPVYTLTTRSKIAIVNTSTDLTASVLGNVAVDVGIVLEWSRSLKPIAQCLDGGFSPRKKNSWLFGVRVLTIGNDGL